MSAPESHIVPGPSSAGQETQAPLVASATLAQSAPQTPSAPRTPEEISVLISLLHEESKSRIAREVLAHQYRLNLMKTESKSRQNREDIIMTAKVNLMIAESEYKRPLLKEQSQAQLQAISDESATPKQVIGIEIENAKRDGATRKH